MQSEKYALRMRILHWLVATWCICQLFVGFYMTSMINSDLKFEIYALHKSNGIFILILGLLFIYSRFSTRIPDYTVPIPRWNVILALIDRYSIYLLLVLMPVSGYIMSSASGRAIVILGIQLPMLVPKNETLANMANVGHSIFSYALVALIILHALGILKHFVMEKYNLLKRMI